MKKKLFLLYIKLFLLIYLIVIRYARVRPNFILFESNVGRNYSGNPKAIYEEIINQGLDGSWQCIWVLENTNCNIPGNCKIVKRLGIRHLYYSAVSHIWVMDSRQMSIFKKRSENVFIQTWHGTPLKKLALDMHTLNMGDSKDLASYKKNFANDVLSWDYLITQNHYSTEIFKRAFNFEKEIWEIGYPRNDLLFKFDWSSINELKKRLGLPLHKKILLYAPTWRDNLYYSPGQWKFDLNLDMERLRIELGDEYIVLIKEHYLIADLDEDAFPADGFVYRFNYTQDIQPLYLVSDVLITDYSSVMFDYSLLEKPMIYYVYDYEEYEQNLRGFYFNLSDEAPGPIVRTQEELIYTIKYELDDYNNSFKDKYKVFMDKYNHAEHGDASKRVVEYLKQLVI